MAVPASGQLKLYADIGVELSVPATNVSLGSMSDQAGFAAPDAMSDFYGYSSLLPPSAVQTRVVSANSSSQVRVCACVQGIDPSAPVEYGAYIGTCANNYACNTKYVCSTTTSTSICYYVTATGLSGSTTYYGWAYGCNTAGITVGARGQATTLLNLTYNAGYMNYIADNFGVFRKAYYEPATASYRDYLSCTFTNYEAALQAQSATITEAYQCSVINAKNRSCVGDISNNAGERAGITHWIYCGLILTGLPTHFIRCATYGFFGGPYTVAQVTSRCCGPNFFTGTLGAMCCGEGVAEGMYMCYCFIP